MAWISSGLSINSQNGLLSLKKNNIDLERTVSVLWWWISHKACSLDRFTKTFFWNFQSIQADLCYILIYKQMLEKVFCSNIAPSLSSGNHLFYKAEYMGQSCPNQVWAITFEWSALAT